MADGTIYGGGAAGKSAYEIYVEVATAAGDPVLSKEAWVASMTTPRRPVLRFATRAEGVAWAAENTVEDGVLMEAAGRVYMSDAAATTISDMPGWRPAPGYDIWADQWPVTLAGGVDDRARIAAMAAFAAGKDIHVPVGGTLQMTATSAAIALAAGTRIVGSGGARSKLRIVGATTDWAYGLNCAAANCGVENISIEFVASVPGAQLIMLQNLGPGFRGKGLVIDGGLEVTEGAPDRIVHVASLSNTVDASDIRFEDSSAANITFWLLKTNAATAINDDVGFVRCRARDCWQAPFTLNTPNAPDCTGFFATDCIVENTRKMSGTAIGVGLASGKNAVIDNLQVRGHWGSDEAGEGAAAIHFEEGVVNAVLTNITAEMLSGNFFNVAANNNHASGLWSSPRRLSMTTFTAAMVGAPQGVGIRLTYDANPQTPGDLLSFSDGIISGFDTGIVCGAWADATVQIVDMLLTGNNYGLRLAAEGAVAPAGLVFGGNLVADVRADRGGVVPEAVFRGAGRRHQVDAGVLEFIDPIFGMGDTVVADGGFHFAVLMTGIVRMDGTMILRGSAGGSNRVFISTYLKWDGTTITETPQESLTAGAFGGSVTLNTGIDAVTITDGGSGYSVGDVLIAAGGTLETGAPRTQLRVTSVALGTITGVEVIETGAYDAIPTAPFSVTEGGGTGATFTYTLTRKVVCAKVYNNTGSDKTIALQASLDGFMAVQ